MWYGQAQLQRLKPNTQYMVQVSSLNNEGYSKFSSITFFSTLREGKENFKWGTSKVIGFIMIIIYIYIVTVMHIYVSQASKLWMQEVPTWGVSTSIITKYIYNVIIKYNVFKSFKTYLFQTVIRARPDQQAPTFQQD